MQVWPAAQLLWYAFKQCEQQPKSESASPTEIEKLIIFTTFFSPKFIIEYYGMV